MRRLLIATVAIVIILGGLTTAAGAHGVGVINACVSPTGDAECGGVAVSGVGNATSEEGSAATATGDAACHESYDGIEEPVPCVAVSGTGDADCTGSPYEPCASATGTGDASGGVVSASGAGNASGAHAISGAGDAAASVVSVTVTGNATGPAPVSAAGGCRFTSDDAYRPCHDEAVDEDANGFYTAASGTGQAEANLVAASGTGDAESCVAASGTGDADGSCSIEGVPLEASGCEAGQDAAGTAAACWGTDRSHALP